MSSPSNLPPLQSLDEIKTEEKNLELQPNLPLAQCGELAMEYATEIATGFQTSIDLVLATMFVVVGMALGKKTKVRLDPYTNTGMLWMAIVARSGYGKTAPISEILRPLKEINEDLLNKTKEALAEWNTIREGKGFPPPKLQMIISDSTPEARSELLPNNEVLIHRDELNGMFKDLNRYNQSGEIENLLSIFSGEGFAVNRKTSATIYISNPFLSIIGGIQPELLQDAFGGKGLAGSGFVARWLFVWIANCKISENYEQHALNPDTMNRWCGLIHRLWRMQPKECRLNQDALDLHNSYYSEVSAKMNDESTTDGEQSMLAKLRIYILRLALIIHFLKYGELAGEVIDGDTMQAAVAACRVFEKWGQMALNTIGGKTMQRAPPTTREDLLREIHREFGINNQSRFAESIGISQQQVSKALNKK